MLSGLPDPEKKKAHQEEVGQRGFFSAVLKRKKHQNIFAAKLLYYTSRNRAKYEFILIVYSFQQVSATTVKSSNSFLPIGMILFTFLSLKEDGFYKF